MGAPSDEELAEAICQGQKRCDAETLMFAPVAIAPDQECLANKQQLVNRQIAAMGTFPVVLGNYVELLRRASRVVEFFADNVGATEDWPVILYSESEPTEIKLRELMLDLGNAVGVLTEV